MSLHAKCPACGRYAKDNSSPSAEWRDVMYDEWEFAGPKDPVELRHVAKVARLWLCPCEQTLWYWPDDADQARIFRRVSNTDDVEAYL